jgi:amidase
MASETNPPIEPAWSTDDAVSQAGRVARGEASPLELVDAAIERIERMNPELNAVIHEAFDAARALARDTALPEGPFRGVPILMKDIGGEQAGQPIHAGMGLLKRLKYTAKQSSYFTEKLLAAGFIPLGRTNTPELALLPTSEPEAYGPTRSPWNTDFSPGGSSGGASAAVASGMVAVAHASDGGGSIRGPAAKCGLIGLKPTRGRCSFGPGMGERWSGFSSEFVVSRTVRDTAALLDVVSGVMPGDPYSAQAPAAPFATALDQEPPPLKIGFMTDAPRDLPVHPELAAAVERMASKLEGLGHHVERARPEAMMDPGTVGHYAKVVAANVARGLDAWSEKLGVEIGPDDVEALTWAIAQHGRSIDARTLLASLEFVHQLGRRFATWWHDDGFDLLLTPTQAQPPVPIGRMGSTKENPLGGFLLAAPYGVYTYPFNLSGQPAISLPGALSEGDADWPAGLPLGVQLVGAMGAEPLLLAVSGQLEAAGALATPLPPIFG